MSQQFVDSLLAGKSDASAVLNSLRGRADLSNLDVPTPKFEEWRFSNPKKLTSRAFGPARAGVVDAKLVDSLVTPESRGARLVFVNGQFSKTLTETSALNGVVLGDSSALSGAELGIVEDALGSVDSYWDDAFAQLNRGLCNSLGVVVIPRDVVVETPIHILYLSVGEGAPWSTHPRTMIVAGPGSKATVIEEYRGIEGEYFTNATTEVIVGENTRLEHVRLQRESAKAFNLLRSAVRIGANATYDSVTATIEGAWNRIDLYAQHDGEGTFCRVDGVALITGDQVADTHSIIDNARPNCESHQLHKCIVDGKARAVFNGKIFVRKDAQKVNAYQLNRNLLLSDNARVHTKPQLEIFADDVRCSHGATIGQLDDEQLFYMVSRGFTPAKAKGLLTYAFAAEVFEHIHVPSLVQELEAEASRRTQS